MANTLSGCLKYFSIIMMILAILYKYEISSDRSSSDKKTLIVTKQAVLECNRSYVFNIITNINKYAMVFYWNNCRILIFSLNIFFSGIQMLLTLNIFDWVHHQLTVKNIDLLQKYF